jgi:hypothetical protein
VLDGGHDLAVGGAVGAELVSDDHPRHRVCLLHQAAEEAPGGCLVPPVLHEDVEHVAVLVDGPPQVLVLPVDLDEDLVQVPLVAGPWPTTAQSVRVGLAELGAPAAHCLVGDDHASLEQQLLDLAEAERESVVQPHAVGYDLDRVTVPPIRRRRALHGRSPSTTTNQKIIPPSQPT